jgi:hypothetical protein
MLGCPVFSPDGKVAVSWLCSDSDAVTNFKLTQVTTSFTKPPDLGKPIYHRALITSTTITSLTKQQHEEYGLNLF